MLIFEMDANYSIPASKVSDCEDIAPSDVEDVEFKELKSKSVGSKTVGVSKDMLEDNLHRLVDKVSEAEHQEIAALAYGALETPRSVFTTLLKEKRILHLQLLLIAVGRRDIALCMEDFAQTHRLVHMQQVTKCLFTIVVFDDISHVMQHELLTVVRSWIPEARIGVTNCVCETWLKKLHQKRKCQECLQHMGVINHILQAYIGQKDITLLRRWRETPEVSIETCETGCEKCSMIDHELKCSLNDVREALYNFNTLKCNIKRYKAQVIPLRSTSQKDPNGTEDGTRRDSRSCVQMIMSAKYGPKCLA
ncbi:uncharacterized protein LOC127850948 [Dreissena polymorpha]|uniref:Uncharacterized protein n=1 Tax=Dreissena polymorpha TaxID=45954 RepID=A0A9D4I1I5_DREPO|nr:uncharacterized protein LOC127850948 [Dreissena polymorpha]KAH3738941.1 hypothetical protein DPMN_045585 [Dreissena polymorpha]